MMLTQLANVARSAGLTVVEQPGWFSRGHGAQSSVQTIVCHHTGTTNTTADAPSLNVVEYGRSDLAGPLSHYLLARSGKVYVIAAGLCWHAGAVLDNSYANQNAIGIEAEGTGTASWPEVQMVAYAKLCKALIGEFKLPVSRVLGHKEVCAPFGRKSDPNFDMDAFRRRIRALGADEVTPQDVQSIVNGVVAALPNKVWGFHRLNETADQAQKLEDLHAHVGVFEDVKASDLKAQLVAHQTALTALTKLVASQHQLTVADVQAAVKAAMTP